MNYLTTMLVMLSSDSTVMVQELAENTELLALIKADTDYEELLEWVNENY
jgi:hypothetical protein